MNGSISPLISRLINRFPSLVTGFLLAGWVVLGGCAAANDPIGADIRKALGVTKNSVEETKDSIERNYDPKVVLKRAEALYQNKEFIEASSEYRHFLDLDPLHTWADYAQFKLGMSYYMQFTTIDRDSGPVQQALDAFGRLLTLYPSSKYFEEAKKRIEVCMERIARHEYYVGRFYFKQEAYPAAIERLQEVVSSYPNQPIAQDSLYYLALSLAGVGKPAEAADRLQYLITQYPAGPYEAQARQKLAQLNVSVRP